MAILKVVGNDDEGCADWGFDDNGDLFKADEGMWVLHKNPDLMQHVAQHRKMQGGEGFADLQTTHFSVEGSEGRSSLRSVVGAGIIRWEVAEGEKTADGWGGGGLFGVILDGLKLVNEIFSPVEGNLSINCLSFCFNEGFDSSFAACTPFVWKIGIKLIWKATKIHHSVLDKIKFGHEKIILDLLDR